VIARWTQSWQVECGPRFHHPRLAYFCGQLRICLLDLVRGCRLHDRARSVAGEEATQDRNAPQNRRPGSIVHGALMYCLLLLRAIRSLIFPETRTLTQRRILFTEMIARLVSAHALSARKHRALANGTGINANVATIGLAKEWHTIATGSRFALSADCRSNKTGRFIRLQGQIDANKYTNKPRSADLSGLGWSPAS